MLVKSMERVLSLEYKKLATKQVSPMLLSTLYKNPNHLIESELPVRLIQSLKMLTSPSLLKPTDLLRLEPIASKYLNDIILLSQSQFTSSVREIRSRHSATMSKFSQTIMGLKKDDLPVNYLSRFYTMAMSTRTLMDEHLSLVNNTHLIQSVDPVAIALKAADDVIALDPTSQIEIVNVAGVPLSTLYIREHLLYMLSELFKNALTAATRTGKSKKLVLQIGGGGEDLVFHLSDQAGGMSFVKEGLLWTADAKNSGLPLCRLMARYLGGDLEVVSMQGYGTDSYLHLTNNGLERIPECNSNLSQLSNTMVGAGTHDAHGEVDDGQWLIKLLSRNH